MLLTDWDRDDGPTQSRTTETLDASEGAVAVERQINNCYKKGRWVKHAALGPAGEWVVISERNDGTGRHCWWGGPVDEDLARYMREADKLRLVAFGAYGAWVAVNGSNGYDASGIADSLEERLSKMNSEGKAIRSVSLSLCHAQGYWILDDDGSQWDNLGANVQHELRDSSKSALQVLACWDLCQSVATHRQWMPTTVGQPATHRQSSANHQPLTADVCGLCQAVFDSQKKKERASGPLRAVVGGRTPVVCS